jgi:hypothetical protein
MSDSPTERELLQLILWRLGRIEKRLGIPEWRIGVPILRPARAHRSP